MNLPRAWTAFGGASLALMGAALACGARRQAADNLAWRRQWRQAVGAPEPEKPEGKSLVGLYRVAGALVGFSGAVFLVSAALGGTWVSAPARTAVHGFLISVVGLGAGVLKYTARSRPPRFLAEDDAPRPADERAADAAIWALCALWAGFGFFLVDGVPR